MSFEVDVDVEIARFAGDGGGACINFARRRSLEKKDAVCAAQRDKIR